MNDTDKNIGKNLGILCRQLNLFLNHELEQYNITASEIMFLGSLFIKDGVSQDELVREFFLDKAAVTRTICSLERKNLIMRLGSEEDKRSKKVYLTEEANVYKDILNSLQNKWYREVLSDSDPDETALFAKTLGKIADNMRNMNDKNKKDMVKKNA